MERGDCAAVPAPMTPLRIDLNCDLGEGGDHDEEILRFITSANVACGYHAGDPATMRRIARAAIANHVAIGAHPGLLDRAGFGRTAMDLTPKQVRDLTLDQIGTLREIVTAEGGTL